MGENAKAFVFLWQSKLPYAEGIILDNTRNGYTVSKKIVTSQSQSNKGKIMEEKTPLEIKEMIDSNPVLKIIDVREQWEFDKCHIERVLIFQWGKFLIQLIISKMQENM